jgi:hypothetical protein
VPIKVQSGSSTAKVLLRLISAAGHTAAAGSHKIRSHTSTRTVSLGTSHVVKISVGASVLKPGRASLIG